MGINRKRRTRRVFLPKEPYQNSAWAKNDEFLQVYNLADFRPIFTRNLGKNGYQPVKLYQNTY